MVGRTNILRCRTIPALLIWLVYRICAIRTLDPLIEFEHPRTHRGTAPSLRNVPFRLAAVIRTSNATVSFVPVADLGCGVERSVTVTAAEDESAFRHGLVPSVAKVFGQLGFKSHLNRLRKSVHAWNSLQRAKVHSCRERTLSTSKQGRQCHKRHSSVSRLKLSVKMGCSGKPVST